ncbi:MAG: acetate--CoA ligase alpha subunit [Nanoarchaeota archaeon]
MNKLKNMFNPKTIAVIGASNKKGHVGYALMRNLISSEYDGIIYPINLKGRNSHGIKVHKSILDVPDQIDLAIIAIPANLVPSIIKECGKVKVKSMVIISAGFKEVGNDSLSDEVISLIRKYDIPTLGPNCLGFMKPSISLNASFANKMPLSGKIAFISQSGALGTAILDWSLKQNVGFSSFVSIGSMLDIQFHDLIDYFADDPQTSSLVIYMESLTNARKFLSAARAFARTKPIIILKVGRSSEGSKAAMSHTGSLTGNDAVFDAAFKRAGIIRVDTIGQLFNSAQTLAMQPRPKGKRLAIVTNAGGPGVIATDCLIANNGELAKLSPQTITRLNNILPPAWSKGNPIDVLGDADPKRYMEAMQICLDDDDIDGILIILTPQAMTDPSSVARGIVSLQNKGRKTILASWMGEDDVNEGRRILEKGSIPVYATPENAVKSFMILHDYSKNLGLLYETPDSIPNSFKPKTEDNRILLDNVTKKGRNVLTEDESKQLLANYDIPIGKSGIAKTPNQAAEISSKLGFPVVMKISSPDIMHKTDVGGVKLNIRSKDEAKKAFNTILNSSKKHMPNAVINGVFIEKMTSRRYELLIGSKKDPIFGPVIVFGMGGIAVEIFKDINMGLPPLNMALAKLMIEDTKIYTLLKGYRGMEGADISSIQFLLYKFAYLLMDFPEIKEIDINPFAIDSSGGVVLDAKVVLDEQLIGKEVKPYSHLVISPYPNEYITEFKLKNGKSVILRPIKPEDESSHAELLKTFSKETQRFRFFQDMEDITHEMLIRYTQIDYDREIAIIAELEEKGKKKFAGVVRLIADPYNETAEFAIAIGDPWQGQGLGNKFTDYILKIAKSRGIKKVYANILKDNHKMYDMFNKRGFKFTDQGDTYRAELSTKFIKSSGF